MKKQNSYRHRTYTGRNRKKNSGHLTKKIVWNIGDPHHPCLMVSFVAYEFLVHSKLLAQGTDDGYYAKKNNKNFVINATKDAKG